MKWLRKIWWSLTKPAALVAWLGDGAKAVPQSEANARAAMCAHCPGNQKSPVLVDFTAHIIRQKLGNETAYDPSLKSCAGCGCDLQLKVWVPYRHIRAWQRDDEADAIKKIEPRCWQL